jgi:hypothetical protein
MCKAMYIFIYIYIYIYVTYIHTYIHTYIKYAHTYINAYVYTYIHTSTIGAALFAYGPRHVYRRVYGQARDPLMCVRSSMRLCVYFERGGCETLSRASCFHYGCISSKKKEIKFVPNCVKKTSSRGAFRLWYPTLSICYWGKQTTIIVKMRKRKFFVDGKGAVHSSSNELYYT